MNLQLVLNSRLGVSLALGLSQAIPQRIGPRLADFLAKALATRRSSSIVKAVRLNQWVATGTQLTSGELDQAVENTLRHNARSLYTLYHNYRDLEATRAHIKIDERVEAILRKSQERKAGAVIVGVHLSNFDFVMQASAQWGLRALVLAFSQPAGGYLWQNILRRYAGVEIVPASMASMREAVLRLRSGGYVMTGLDRPVPSPRYKPCFFGHPAHLPVHYVTLALKSGVPVLVTCAIQRADGLYHILISEPIPMQRDPDHRREIVENSEAVLRIAEDFIRQAPQQWAMFHPVWPQLLGEVP